MITDDRSSPARFWDDVYRAADPTAPPRPNAVLVDVVSALDPGTALDLGCGRGGDAIWLARSGWRVHAVDVSGVAVDRLTAAAQGLAVTAEQVDLAAAVPEGRFDLVSACYLHTPLDLPRAALLRTAATRLAPGGRLLVVDHGSAAPWSWDQDPDARFPTPHEVAAELALDPAQWSVERAESPRRVATGPDGRTAEVVDHVLVLRRGPA